MVPWAAQSIWKSPNSPPRTEGRRQADPLAQGKHDPWPSKARLPRHTRGRLLTHTNVISGVLTDFRIPQINLEHSVSCVLNSVK